MKVNGKLHAPAPLTPRETAPNNQCIAGWVGPRISPGIMEKQKISYFYKGSNPNYLVIQPVAHSLYRLSYILIL